MYETSCVSSGLLSSTSDLVAGDDNSLLMVHAAIYLNLLLLSWKP
jgi:hypothetical protein